MKQVVLALCALAGLAGCDSYSIKKKIDPEPEEHRKIYSDAKDAYIYGYPLVLMDITKDVFTNTPNVGETKAPINQFLNVKTFPDSDFQEVVSPNADTLYSTAWLDLTEEPIILSVPAVGERYYLMPILDAWTNVIASPGSRTTGNEAHDFAIVGPNWKNSLPQGVKEIKSPTNVAWILGRTEAYGLEDYAAVNKIQEEYKLTPLSAWGKPYTPPSSIPVKPNVNTKVPPVEQVEDMSADVFFARLSNLLKQNPPPAADKPIVNKLTALGIHTDEGFDPSNLSQEDRAALDQAVFDARKEIRATWNDQPQAEKKNNWNFTLENMGTYGTDYLQRALVAFGGLGANLPEDAIYPVTHVDSESRPLNGAYKYVIHFDKDETPPVDGFWSITLYNDKQFFVKNPIGRYAIGDRSDLEYNDDGSLDIYIQNQSPDKDKESNWLPAPKDNFNLIMRLYWPNEEVLEGDWAPPAVKRVD